MGKRTTIRRRSALLAVVALLGAAGLVPAQGLEPLAGFRVVRHEPLSPGVDHWLIRRDDLPQHVHVARLSADAVWRLRPVLSNDAVAGPGPLLETTSAMCARTRCVVAVNGDFTDPPTGEPVGAMVVNGELVRTPGIPHAQLVIGADGRPSIGHGLFWSASLRPPVGDPFSFVGVNVQPGVDGISLLTPRYGSVTPSDPSGTELVLDVADSPPGTPPDQIHVALTALRSGGGTPLHPGRFVLWGQGAGAARLGDVWARNGYGAAVLELSALGARQAIGGSPVLVMEGRRTSLHHDDRYTQGRHPRTIVGWTAAGDVLLVTIDGRQPGHSVGMSLPEAADLLVSMGAVEAMNLDGGGSTTFVVDGVVQNRPSDGPERAVVSALVVAPPEDAIAAPRLRSIDRACPPSRVPEDGFADVADANPHEPTVDCTVWWEVARGMGRSVYAPARSVTRGQLASFITRLVVATGATVPAGVPDRFPDDAGSPHEASINFLAAAGVVGGRADGTFGADVPVRRDQLATFLVRAYELRVNRSLPAPADYFADDGRSVHQSTVNRAAGAGLAGGDTAGRYRPADPVRRDQMASFLARTLALALDEGVMPPR